MTVVNPKSISGINSITTGSGSDDVLTIHNNNGTERLRVQSDKVMFSVDAKVDGDGTRDLGAEGAKWKDAYVTTLTASSSAKVGSGVTLSLDGDAFFTGVVTATSYSGIDLGAVTGATGDFSIADKIVHTGDTNTAIRFPAADTVSVETGGSERARINSDGQLLVGTTETSPYANRTGLFNKNGGNYVSVTTDSSNDCGIVFGDGTGQSGANYESYIAHSNSTNDFTINVNQGNDSRHLKVKSTGNVEIGNGNLVLADGHGIDFSATANSSATGSTMSNELLDDYEEGSWTPQIRKYVSGSFGTAAGMASNGTVQRSTYTKIGNVVTLFLHWDGFQVSDANYAALGGLPFNTASSGGGGGTVGYTDAFTNNQNQGILVGSGGDNIYFYINSNAWNGWSTSSARTLYLQATYLTS